LSCSWTVELGEENPEVSTWALSVENNSQDHEVVEVLFPYIRGVNRKRISTGAMAISDAALIRF
jgi:hypothetical protein